MKHPLPARTRLRAFVIGLAFAAFGSSTSGRAATPPVAAPEPQEVAPGVWLIPGGILPNRQPDGNS